MKKALVNRILVGTLVGIFMVAMVVMAAISTLRKDSVFKYLREFQALIISVLIMYSNSSTRACTASLMLDLDSKTYL